MNIRDKRTEDIDIPRTANWAERTMAELAKRQVLATEALITEQRKTNELLGRMLHPTQVHPAVAHAAAEMSPVTQVSGPPHPIVRPVPDIVHDMVMCPHCRGRGIDGGHSGGRCPMCHGTGQVTAIEARRYEGNTR